jgi:hypothetical protein
MTVTIELTDDQAAALQAQAQRRGQTLEAWIAETLAAYVPKPPAITDPEEWQRVFDEWINSHDPNTPVLSDEAMSRESIYPDRT